MSQTGHLGPMGLEDTIAREGVWPDGKSREWINVFDIEQAIDRGMDFYGYLLKRYDNEELAFTAYNIGETALNSATILVARKYGFTYSEKENKSKNALEFMKENFKNSYVDLIIDVKTDKGYVIPKQGRDYYDNILEKKKYIKTNKSKYKQRVKLDGTEIVAFNE